MKSVDRIMCIAVAVFLIGCGSNSSSESEPSEGELGYQTIRSGYWH